MAPVTLRKKPIEEMEQFTYLDRFVVKHGGTEAAVKARIGKALKAMPMYEIGSARTRA